ncbi:MAG: DUF4167 domain-containing protein [Sphingomonadales bacterium]|nr:DUF4167 domain-containing protein [Sphingomonadales bacterium]
MRSSKSRSRNKSNRQRSIGNIINRVFDSSGPEGKVRGTPQQIIDKYLQLARDAQLGNDRVAEQNFLQHAEHYTRMLGEAQREMAREQEERQRQFGGNGQNGNGQSGNGQNGNGQGGNGGQSGQQTPRERHDERADDRISDRANDRGAADQGDIALPGSVLNAFDAPEDDGPGLVETPEMRAEVGAEPADSPADSPADGREDSAPKAAKPRNRRAPRKPKADKSEGKSEQGGDTAPQASDAE